MSQFLKKNAKLFYILFAVFSFLFVILACVYITPYYTIAVKFNSDFLSGELQAVASDNLYLNTWCKKSFTYFVGDAGQTFSSGSDFFVYMFNMMYDYDQQIQAANNLVLNLGVVSLVMVAIMMICSNHSRKKFYISNLVSGIVCPAVSIIMGIITLVANLSCISPLNANYITYNWGSLANQQFTYTEAQTWIANGDTSHFSLTPMWFVVYGVIIILFIIAAGALLAYNVYRYKLTKKELAQEEVGA